MADGRSSGRARLLALVGFVTIAATLAAAYLLRRPDRTPPAYALAGTPAPAGSHPARSAPSERVAQEKFFPSLRIEAVEERLPPITLAGQPFSVVVYKRRLVWPADAHHAFDPDDDETAESFEVRDAGEGVVFSRALNESVQPDAGLADVRRDGRFGFSTSVSALRLDGGRAQALLVDWGDLPSAPDACSTFIVLGLFEGRLVPFAEPFCGHVQLADPTPAGSSRLANDAFEIRYWTGHFNVFFPVKVDFVAGRLRPAQQCLRMVDPAAQPQPRYEDLCDYRVEAERVPSAEDTFVRLFPEPDEQRAPTHVVVRPASKVEYLAARTRNVMTAQGRWNDAFDEYPWLQVRIDGRVGWVRAEEDLLALGLPQAG